MPSYTDLLTTTNIYACPDSTTASLPCHSPPPENTGVWLALTSFLTKRLTAHAHLGTVAANLSTFGRSLAGFGGIWRDLTGFGGIDRVVRMFYSCCWR